MIHTLEKKSELAKAIQFALDNSNMFNRKGWAVYFGTSEKEIDNWTQDLSAPGRDCLFLLYSIMKESDHCEKAEKILFKIYKRPSTEVSPHGKDMLPTIWEHMTKSEFDSPT